MTTVYDRTHLLAIAAGILCTVAEAVSTTDHIVKQVGTFYDPAVYNVIAMSIGVMVALTFAVAAFNQRHVIIGSCLLLAFVLGSGHVISTTLDRVGSARDTSLAKVWAADPQVQELVRLKQQVTYSASRECGTGRGKRCDDISQEIGVADKRIDARKGELDSMGRRIAGAIPGISASQASLYQPMLMPFALYLFGTVFLAFGANGRRVKPTFQIQLTGRDAQLDKARKFAAEFRVAHGRMPRPAEVSKALCVSDFVARGLTRDIAA